MSVVNRDQVKVLLPRNGSGLYKLLGEHFAKDNRRHWKYLAMLALRVNAGWSHEEIGHAFGHPKGHVSRCLVRVKQQVRELFEVEPELRSLLEEDDEPGSHAA